MGSDLIRVPKVGYGLTDILKIHAHKRNKVETPLLHWMAKNNLGVDAIAVAIGVNHASVSQWRHGQCVPGLVQAFLLERLSKGEVPVSSWMGVPAAIAKFQQFEAKRKSRQAGNYSTKTQRAGSIR